MSTLTSILRLLAHNPVGAALLLIALLWWIGSRILRTVEYQARRPLFVAWLLWRWSRRRR
jgi:hypothetical protein